MTKYIKYLNIQIKIYKNKDSLIKRIVIRLNKIIKGIFE